MAYLSLKAECLSTSIRRAIKKAKKLKFDSIAYTGHSGALVAIPMAVTMKKNLVIVRKPHEKSHGSVLERFNGSKRCLIVDDFIESGKTIRRIIKYLKSSNLEVEAILLYNTCSERKTFDGTKIVRCCF